MNRKLKSLAPKAGAVFSWGLPAILTTIALCWSVAALGWMLDHISGTWLAYSGAVLFDVVWIYAMFQEWRHHRRGGRGQVPQRLGWGCFAVSLVVLFTHGLIVAPAGNYTGWAAAAIKVGFGLLGILVPALAKVTLVIALDAANERISPETQKRIDDIRAGTRNKLAIGRTVMWAKVAGQREDAALKAAEYKAKGDAQKLLHEALEAYSEIVKEHPVPERADDLDAVPDDFGLITDEDIEQFLAGVTNVAGGTPGGTDSSSVPGTHDHKAMKLLAAEVYAGIEAEGVDVPPSQREFRRRIREAMVQRQLKCSNEYVADLWRHERALRITSQEGK